MANVCDYGAAGDGVQDDSDAIDHALQAGDGQLVFPRGEFCVTRSLVVELARTGRFSVNGSGGGAKLIMEGPGPLWDVRGTHAGSADPASFEPGVGANERQPMFADFEIEGRHPEADGIRLNGTMQPTLSGVQIRGCRHAVHVTGRARNLLVANCHFYFNRGVGVFLDHVNLHQANIVGSHISYHRLGGIRIVGSEVRNLQITGCDIEYNNHKAHAGTEPEPTAEIFIDCRDGGTVREGTISSCTIQATYSPGGANIRFLGAKEPDRHKAGMWTITGNLIGSQSVNVHLDSTWGVVFEGNYVYSGHDRNVLVERSRNIVIGPNAFGHNPDYGEKELCTGIRLVDCDYVVMQGVQIQDAQAGRHTVNDAPPRERSGLVELERCRWVNMQGCQFLEGEPATLWLKECRDVQIANCQMLDTREVPRTSHSVHWLGAGSNNRVSQCQTNRPHNIAQAAGVTVRE